MRRTLTLLIASALLSLALAVPASADLGSKIVKDFSDDGQMDPCIYSASEVKLIKSQIANDTDAYDPDLRSAVDAMFEQRAEGACNKKKKQSGGGSAGASGGAGTTGTSGTPSSGGGGSSSPSTAGSSGSATSGGASVAPAPATPQTAAPLIDNGAIPAALRSADEGDVPPVPLLVLAALLALMALGAIVYGAIRFTGWEPRWAPRARHAAAEAGWRASSTWAEFTDFVRLGR